MDCRVRAVGASLPLYVCPHSYNNTYCAWRAVERHDILMTVVRLEKTYARLVLPFTTCVEPLLLKPYVLS